MQAKPEDETTDLIVVGAGAAGLWCAARAAELGRGVLLLEKTPRTGTKVLASGGTRCNLTTTLGPEEAGRLFGPRGERFLKSSLRALGPREVRERFHALGVPTSEAPLEKVFPVSGRARDVRDALLAWAVAAGARIRTNAPVRAVERRSGGWCVRLEDGERIEGRSLVLSPGGKSVPRTGTTGDGYAWLSALDLELVPPVPALVPLTSPASWVRDLTGIALQEVEARLLGPDGRLLGRRSRPVVFTHSGVSGPGAMDLSESAARAGADTTLVLDLFPAAEREDLRALLIAASGAAGAPSVGRALARQGLSLPKRLVAAAGRQAGLDPGNPPARVLTRPTRHALVEALKGMHVPIDGTAGFDHAEVTAGGLALSALDPGSMRVRGREELFVIGELLDLQGPIGGLNFQAAFSTAEAAARACARRPVG